MKYFVKQFDDERCDNEPYFSDFISWNKNIIIDGGRDFKSYNDEVLCEIKSMIDDYYIFEYHYNQYDNFSDYVWNYIRQKENGKRLSKREIGRLKRAFERNDLSSTPYEENIIITALSIIFGKQYILTFLNGCSQGDSVDCYLPDETPNETIQYLEALYWNTGNEVMVDDTDRDDIKNANDVDGYCMYITDYDLKRGIANELGCNEDDIILFEFTGYSKVPTYKIA